MNQKLDELDQSVADGIITLDQASAIRARRTDGANKAASNLIPSSEEPLTLISNFGDIFLCLGLVILYSSSLVLAYTGQVPKLAAFVTFAVIFWLLAEYFVFQLHRNFPALLSTCLFVLTIFQGAILYLGTVDFTDLSTSNMTIGYFAVLAGAFAIVLVRFRLPILVVFLGISTTFLLFTTVKLYWADAPAFWVLSGCGMMLLAIGTYVDTFDRSRTGIHHEWALWLFVVGSPLTIHPLFINLMTGEETVWSNPSKLMLLVLVLALVFTLAGLLLDRRSLVASSLLYLSVALTYAIHKAGIDKEVVFAAIAFVMGVFVLVMGTQWTRIRGALLKVTPYRSLFRPLDPVS